MLGLLTERPYTSYDLNLTIRATTIHKAWPCASSSLYLEPKKLVDWGYAKAKQQVNNGRPSTLYNITKKGRVALKGWLVPDYAGNHDTFHENGVRFLLSYLHGSDYLDNLLQLMKQEAIAELIEIENNPYPDTVACSVAAQYDKLRVQQIEVRLNWIVYQQSGPAFESHIVHRANQLKAGKLIRKFS